MPITRKSFRFPAGKFRTPADHRKIIMARDKRDEALVTLACQQPKPKKSRKSRSERREKRKRGVRLAGYETYAQYLLSPEWKAVRARWMKSEFCRGEVCHTAGCRSLHALQLHHRTYARIGYEDMKDLVLVCQSCHYKIHALQKTGVSLKAATVKIVGY